MAVVVRCLLLRVGLLWEIDSQNVYPRFDSSQRGEKMPDYSRGKRDVPSRGGHANYLVDRIYRRYGARELQFRPLIDKYEIGKLAQTGHPN